MILGACGGSTESYVPKPKAYPKIALPTKSYQPYSVDDLPIQLELPAYARICCTSLPVLRRIIELELI